MTLIPNVFPILRTLKTRLDIHLKFPFDSTFDKEDGKLAQTLFKFARRHLYQIS